MAYDINGDSIYARDEDEAENALVFCVWTHEEEWAYVSPFQRDDADAGVLGQCHGCGNSGSFRVVWDDARDRPRYVECATDLLDDVYADEEHPDGRPGCGYRMTVHVRRVGNERVGVVLP